MKKHRFFKAKAILLLFPVLIFSAFTISGSTCYLQYKTPALTNPFYKGIVNIGVVENNSDSSPDRNVTDGLNITLTGQTADKNVWIKNLDTPGHNAPVYIRVKLVSVWRNADGTGTGIPADVTYTLAPVVTGTTGEWVKTGTGLDATYYFTKPVEPGSLTGQLLDSVTVNGSVPAGKKLEINVLADAVQSDGGAAEITWGVNPEMLQS